MMYNKQPSSRSGCGDRSPTTPNNPSRSPSSSDDTTDIYDDLHASITMLFGEHDASSQLLHDGGCDHDDRVNDASLSGTGTRELTLQILSDVLALVESTDTDSIMVGSSDQSSEQRR